MRQIVLNKKWRNRSGKKPTRLRAVPDSQNGVFVLQPAEKMYSYRLERTGRPNGVGQELQSHPSKSSKRLAG